MVQGTITELGPGRFWARAPKSMGRKSLGVHPTRELAQGVLAETLYVHSQTRGVASETSFAKFGARVLDMREEDGIRSVDSERRRFSLHLETCAIATKSIDEIEPVDIADLMRALARKQAQDKREARKISRKTVHRCMALVRGILDAAIERGIRPDNPCAAVKIRRKQDEQTTEDPWTFLTLDEQRAVRACQAIPEWARVMMQCAWGSGIRQGEQWNLELRDVHCAKDEKDPRIVVRFGSKGKPPKNGRIRTVPLFGDSLISFRRWLEILPKYAPKNPSALAFPGPTGARRGVGAPSTTARVRQEDGTTKIVCVELLPRWLALAGIDRGVRWHDLRHTCCSSLVSGIWGRTWTLEEIMDLAGHSSILVTQKYAHLGPTVTKRAGLATPGGGSAPRLKLVRGSK